MNNSSNKAETLVGLTGFARAGKSEISGFLRDEYGYRIVKPSSVVRDALVRRYGERSFARPEYRAMSEELRAVSGPGYYLDDIDYRAARTAVDGTRHLDTARFIRQRGGFLIGIVARSEERFKRALAAADGKYTPASLEEFEREERPEMNATDHTGGQILKVLCTVEPSHIIDTSDMSLAEVRIHIADLLSRHDISPS